LATHIVNFDPKAIESVHIESAQLSNNVTPIVALGEVLTASVRHNSTLGKGSLNIGGQLIRAQLPPNLAVGDHILTKVTATGTEIVLKILEIQRASPIQPGGLTFRVANQLQNFIHESGPLSLRAQAPFILPSENNILQNILANVQKNVVEADRLIDSNTTLNQLISYTDGNLTELLTQSTNSIKAYINQYLPTESDRILSALYGRLTELLTSVQEGRDIKEPLSQLISALTKEIKEKTITNDKTKDLLQSALSELRTAINAPSNRIEALLQNIKSSIEQSMLSKTSTNSPLDNMQLSRLQLALMHIEQMVNSQKTLNQLNPLMQALGEPALILLPFLFQGLIAHSEITIDSRDRGGKQKKGQDKYKKSSRNKSEEPYHRIQVSVPLPSIGKVDVDIAQRKNEIYARFTVEDKEIGEFLLGQLEFLAASLREQGYENSRASIKCR
jgi:hypothetical protein